MDRFFCLQKLSNQSITNYIQEVQSPLYALERAGQSLSESEFTNLIGEGLDKSFEGGVRYYSLIGLSFSSLYTLLLRYENKPENFNAPCESKPI